MKSSRVPAWDARGLGTLPWQAVACADMTADGRFVAIGTIAPAGDPHVFLVDANGAIVGEYRCGERWIDQVVIGEGGAWLAALCTTPTGHAGDPPIVKVFAKGQELAAASEAITRSLGGMMRFQYGDHSNHLSHVMSAMGSQLAVAGQGGLQLFSFRGSGPPGETKSWTIGNEVTAFAVSPAGRALAGLLAHTSDANTPFCNLVAGDANTGAPLWRRPVAGDVESAPATEKGTYGPPAGSYEDLPVWAPLSAAVNGAGTLFASADYQGWSRRFPARDCDLGVCFTPSRPTVSVYDAQGRTVARFGPEMFESPLWADLVFSADSRKLLAFGHSWTSRGLGGQGRLPADEQAACLYVLNLQGGLERTARFPDAIASVAVAPGGRTLVSCWDGRIYVLDDAYRPLPALAAGIDVGVPALVRASADGKQILAAGNDGVVRMLEADGREIWRNDLNHTASHGDKPWTRNQRLEQLGPGVWVKVGQRTHSDMANQYIVEAPDGLILIEANGGLSIEQTWAQMQAAGLDPMRVRYVLLTHEHGDHAPGAYLWRVITGAQMVSSPVTAYMLRHHTQCCGYGFHPPQPCDIAVEGDQELTLAGLKIKVLRLSGHTYGSQGFAFQVEGKTYVAIGDLIMPGGTLGYPGSLDFSAEEVLASLRKVQALKPDTVLGGHGRGEVDDFIGKGIAAAVATGWKEGRSR